MCIKRSIQILLALVVAFTVAGCAGTSKMEPASAPASATAEKTFAKFHTIVDEQFVQSQITIPMAADVMIIDSRPRRAKYNKGHIPGATSIPDSQFAKMTDQLPANKDALLIFYCGGLKCPLSHKSAFKAEALGYKNVKVFAKGFPGYMKMAGSYSTISAKWLKQQIDKKADLVVVDSRPKRAKYDKGHIPGAISIPDTKFAKMTDRLPADKSKALVFYCGGFKCPLSHKSAKKAMDLGYSNVKVFAAGFPAWKKLAGTSAMATKTAPALKAGEEEGSIDIAVFKQTLKANPQSIYLVDVRDPGEFKTGHMQSAVNIPVDNLENKIPSLPMDKPVVFVCSTGARSGEAYYMVQDVRPQMKKVFYLEAEVEFAKDGSFKIIPPKA